MWGWGLVLCSLGFSRVESQFIMAALEQEACSVPHLVFKHYAGIKQLSSGEMPGGVTVL